MSKSSHDPQIKSLTTDAAGAIEEAKALLERLADVALETATKLGAQGAAVSTSTSRQLRLVVEAGQFTLANSLETRSLGIGVHVDQKAGSTSINTATEESVRQAVTDAVALARFSVPDEALTLATPAEAPPATPLPFLWDAELAAITLPEMQATMRTALDVLLKDKRVALDRFEMQVDLMWHGYRNNKGVKQSERQTQADWSFFGMARDGEEVSGFDYDGGFSFARAGLTERCVAHAEAFAKKIVGTLKPGMCPSYKGPVLLSPRAVQELLLGMILFHAGGRQVMDGKSKWDKAVGTKVMSDSFTLRDAVRGPTLAGATSFDGDGIPTREQAIVERGTLALHLHDVYSAKRCKTKSTATSGGPFALQVAAGKEPLAKLQAAHPRLLIVDRFSGNDDPVQGDFSGVAKSSRLFEAGRDAGPVAETMIAGNFFELAKQILAVGDTVHSIGGRCEAPCVLIDGVSVTGGAG
jgi:PmbA protein